MITTTQWVILPSPTEFISSEMGKKGWGPPFVLFSLFNQLCVNLLKLSTGPENNDGQECREVEKTTLPNMLTLVNNHALSSVHQAVNRVKSAPFLAHCADLRKGAYGCFFTCMTRSQLLQVEVTVTSVWTTAGQRAPQFSFFFFCFSGWTFSPSRCTNSQMVPLTK